MIGWCRQILSYEFWRGGNRPWYGSLGTSTALHVCAVLLLALWSWQEPPATPPAVVETAWLDEPLAQVTSLERIDTAVVFQRQEAGGRAGPTTFAPSTELTAVVGQPTTSSSRPAPSPLGEGWRPGNLADAVSLGTGNGGRGNGNGTGLGDGDGGGFFGIPSDAKRVVYVVDCSKSMNHPHDSEWKTRFRRVKAELLQSIGHMDESFEFFVIFFNYEARPMPAAALQPATPFTKQRYLTWVAQMEAVGSTDPRPALSMALRLRPEVIYFLTDGSFDRGVARQLVQLRQKGTKIHTFAFGNPDGESVLKEIAEANGGRYCFVP